MSDFSVTLEVRNSSSDPSSKYINVNATSGQNYSFRYIGGSDGDGGITEIIGSGPSKITVSIGDPSRYEITSCQFDNDDKHDLSYVISTDKKSMVITDTDVDQLTGYYKILVKDNNTPQALIWCDPPIRNKPGTGNL